MKDIDGESVCPISHVCTQTARTHGAISIPGQPDHQVDVSVLVIEPDTQLASEIRRVIDARRIELDLDRVEVAHHARQHFVIREVLASLADLHACSLRDIDIVLCSASLPDGSGLDALAFLRGIRRDLPVVLTGLSCDKALAVDAIRFGAQDFVVISTPTVQSLPLIIEKSIAHHRIRLENERLHTDLSRSLAELAVKNQQLQMMITQLESMARTDELTGLSNRRWINLMLEGYWADASRNGLPLAFVMIDLDGFKQLNDAMGHPVGDEVLRLTARTVDANCRDVDVTGRFGGDEFCVMMPHTSADAAVHVAHRVHRAFAEAAARRPAGEPRIGMSIGIAHVDMSRPASLAEFIRHADEALYAAKDAGKGRIMIRGTNGPFTPAMAVHH